MDRLSKLQQAIQCVENSHFSTIGYCTVKLAPAAKLIQYYLRGKGSQISDGSSRANLQSANRSTVMIKRPNIQSDITLNSNTRHK